MLVILWRFVVAPSNTDAFLRAYDAQGAWSQLFARAEGYVNTELLRSGTEPEVYVTADRWVSREAYSRFRQTFAAEYLELDRRLEGLALEETDLGWFETAEAARLH